MFPCLHDGLLDATLSVKEEEHIMKYIREDLRISLGMLYVWVFYLGEVF